jgi:hypothetical protein
VVVLFDGDRTNDSWRLIPQPNNNYTLGVNRWYLGEVNTGDPQTLTDLVSWAIANYPSRNIYLAIADHGRGTTGVAWDDTSNRDSLSPSELRSALNSATNSGQIKIDIVHFDTCLMAMLEDAYQLKDLARYMVASENLGWSVFAYNQYINPITGRALEVDLGSPYGPLVGQVTDETTPLQLATYIADSYHNHPALEDMPRTISVTDLSRAASVRAKLDALAALLRLNINTYKDNIKNTRTNLQKFDSRDYYRITQDDEYVDLYHMAEKLKSFIPDATLQAAAQELMGAISSYVVVEHHKSGIWSGNEDIYWNLDNAHGVSIYFPPKSGTTDYNRYIDHTTFRMTIDSQWDDFLQDYFSVMGLPPDDIADPGLPPMLTTTFYIHLPVIQRP